MLEAIIERIDGPVTLVSLAFLGLVWRQYTEHAKRTEERLYGALERNTKAMTELTEAIKNGNR